MEAITTRGIPMATAPLANDNEVTILARILVSENGQFPEGVARYILDQEITDQDRLRMHDLAVRNQDDELTPAEKAELHGFAKATSLLSILKSKARRALGVKPQDRPLS